MENLENQNWEVDCIYHIKNDDWEADFYVVVEDIESRGRFPVRTRFLFGTGGDDFGDGWSLDTNHTIKKVGHKDEYPEYYL